MALTKEFKKRLAKIAGKENVFDDDIALALNSYDCSAARAKPEIVVDVKDAGQIPQIIALLSAFKTPFTPRMSATNHCGAIVPLRGGCVLNLAPLNKILEINSKDGFAIVETGVINQELQNELAKYGRFYAPDPASKNFSTIGGNAALNAGGGKGLKYGSTTANILKAEIVLPDGTREIFSSCDTPNLLPLFTHAEGTLGIITKLWVKILPKPKKIKTLAAYFATLEDCINAACEITSSGIMPSALEAMDETTLRATKKGSAPCNDQGKDEAMLLVEIDDNTTLKEISAIAARNKALKIQTAVNEEEREKLWDARRKAYSAMSALAPDAAALDGTVPIKELAAALKETRAALDKYGLRAGLVFHAGDGNVHTNIIYDERNPYETASVRKAINEINAIALKRGGTLSGEHGIGVEKRAAMKLMFNKETLGLFRDIKKTFDPENISNPDKAIPVSCGNDDNDLNPSPATRVLPLIKGELKEGAENEKIKSLAAVIAERYKNNMPAVFVNGLPEPDLYLPCEITDIDIENHTVSAQTGAKVKDINKKLSERGVYLPFDFDGALASAFLSGSLGEFVNYATAMTAILPDGRIIKAGGKYVKNCAGYEIIRLMSGSGGLYGLVAELTFRTFKKKPKKIKAVNTPTFKLSGAAAKLKKVFDKKELWIAK
jgi:glycolate oxidase subunit GlcD